MRGLLLIVLLVVLAYLVFTWYRLKGNGDVNGSDTSASGQPAGASITEWAQAIKAHEGWLPGSRSFRNNNPGNLKGRGDAGTDADGFAVFSSSDLGMAALERDLSAKVEKYPNFSILQIMTRYLGGNPLNPQVTDQGDPFAYASAVAKRLGADINAKLGELFGSSSGTQVSA